MMKLRTFIALMLATPAVLAAPITVGDQQKITNTAQSFQFNFNNLAQPGGNGTLSIILNGDYSVGAPSEFADFKLETFGTLSLGGAWTNGIKSNNVTGLTFSSYALKPGQYADDRTHSWVFNMSDSLLNSLLSDSKFKVTVNNSGQVNSYRYTDLDYVDIKLSYNEAQSPAAEDVPEPTSLALSGLGLALVAVARRRRKSA